MIDPRADFWSRGKGSQMMSKTSEKKITDH